MVSVKWIKLSTAMFDDEKIKLIEQMPDADTILVIWIKLLSQAGKTNSSGYIFLSENIPFTEEMLATIFNRQVSTIRLALKTFEDLGMIGVDDNSFISISNWEKHQNVEGLDKIREQNRLRQQRYRDNKDLKSLEAPKINKKKDSNVTVTSRNDTELELELEEELDRDKDKYVVGQPDIDYKEIVEHLNLKAGKQYRATTKKTQSLIKARVNEGFGVDDFKKVIDNKAAEWKNDKDMNKFLRPETLFGTKFEGYLNQQVKQNIVDMGYDPERDSF